MREVKWMMRRRHFPPNILIRSDSAATWTSYRCHASRAGQRRVLGAIFDVLDAAGVFSLLEWARRRQPAQIPSFTQKSTLQ